ncbi:YheC/YheD family protein [Paenibacillus oenotherae]|uniref:YheC/YheD family protein n=1 Tax=Paenibacillus oenotherae TaxID=1435645 RepID=A0ABS7DBB7_9BACL|nr:YheC/YheD family protein [Paenibacillus oenotherae]MBW7477043.1 YheC/YheD family protein [Paenibacillus oenotherae]
MMRSKTVNTTIGIMASQRPGLLEQPSGGPIAVPEDAFCRKLCQLGKQLGMLVYVFDPSSCFHPERTGIAGYTLENGQWCMKDLAYPDCIYDRSLCTSSEQRHRRSQTLAELKRQHPYILLNGELPNKWDVYCAMREDNKLQPFLPPTFRYDGNDSIAALMDQYPDGLFFKPSAGMQGRGTLRLRRGYREWYLDGRTRHNKPISLLFSLHAVRQFIGFSDYIVQPYLQLSDHDGTPYDIRSLIQKDEHGRWSLTGIALREGVPGGVTANLHGGGTPLPASKALEARFGRTMSADLLALIKRLSEDAAHCLEGRFGRFAELGLDFGIEPDGRIWLLEANAKPGRAAFAAEPELARLAVERPLRYAKLIANHRYPIVQTAAQNLSQQRDNIAIARFQRRYVQEVHP